MSRFTTLIFISLHVILQASHAQDIPFMDGAVSSQRKADRYFEREEYAAAAKYYTQALEKAQEDDAVELMLARCYVKLRDPENASRYYGDVINSELATDQDVLNYADALGASSHYDEALEWYEIYHTSNPEDDHILRKKGGLLKIADFYLDSVAYEVHPAPFNSENADFSPVYHHNRTLFVSNRKKNTLFQFTDGRSNEGFLSIYEYSGTQADQLKAFGRGLHAGPLTLFDGGKKAIVTVNQKESLRTGDRVTASRLKLVIYAWKDGKWAYEADFPFNNDAYSVFHPSFDEANQTLYFASDRTGGKGGADLYRCQYRNGTWSEPENMTLINTQGDEAFPFIASNGELYFASNGYAGLGGLDIYKTNSAHPENVYNPGYPINTSADDFGLVLDSSNMKGYLCSKRKNGLGDDDIYELAIYKVKVESQLLDEDTGLPVSGKVQIIDQRTGEEVSHERAGDKIVFEVLKGRPYLVKTATESYVATEMEFKTMSDKGLVTLDVPVAKQPEKIESEESASPARIVRVVNLAEPMIYWIMSDQKLKEAKDTTSAPVAADVEIKDVFFWFDSDELRSGEESIKALADLLKSFEKIDLEVMAYCDEFGPTEYNDRLAERRIKMVIDYLERLGISSDRIRPTVIGDKKLYNTCSHPQQCSVEQHQKNRRVEFGLIPK